MPLTVDIRYAPQVLTTPYVLSFGTIKQFDTFLVRAISASGTAHGEITPLPGYSDESTDTIRKALSLLSDLAGNGVSFDESIRKVQSFAPMTASGVAAAAELSRSTGDAILQESEKTHFDTVALCGGSTPTEIAENALRLTNDGFRTLKMKLGTCSLKEDIQRIEAAAKNLLMGTKLRLDANQCFTVEQTEELLDQVAGFPIELLEQPLPPDNDSQMKDLKTRTDIPLMLDESIWDETDIDRASHLGVGYVKLKLCKHLGISGTISLIRYAKAHDLSVVFGNGVQTAIGNRQELYIAAREDVVPAVESNGFAKAKGFQAYAGMSLENGVITLNGPTDSVELFNQSLPVAQIQFGLSAPL